MKYFFLSCYLLAFTAHSNYSDQPNHPKETLTIAFGDALAPWVIPEKDSGILIDIINEAFAPLDYKLSFAYYPYLRRINSFRLHQMDIVSDMNPNTMKSEKLTGYFSGEVYAYENYAYTLSTNNFSFTHLNQLAKYSLMSWQGAITHLGGDYAKMAQSNANYVETHDQSIQLKMLFRERIQVIQLDEKIFDYYRLQLINTGQGIGTAKVDKFPLFGRSPNGFLFKDEKIKNAFLQQLALMKKDGRLDKIYLKYTAILN